MWNQCIDKFFKELGLQPCKSDPCCYLKIQGKKILIVLLYVDDLLIAGTSQGVIQELKTQLNKRFEMSDLGEVSHLLGMHITRDRQRKMLFINQKAYISKALERFGLSDCNPTIIPMDPNTKLKKLNMDEVCTSKPYRSLIGTLLYAASHTRPDISYGVSYLSRFMENPSEEHWNYAKRILRYLKGTATYGILFDGRKPFTIEGYTDADWGSDVNNKRRSTSGWIFTLCGGAITWKSKQQTSVALSSCEAEFVAMSEAVKELLWLTYLLEELKQNQKITLWIDNQAAKFLAENEVVHSRSKHIDIRYWFVKDKIQHEVFNLSHVSSESNTADVFTKALPAPSFRKFRDKMGVMDKQLATDNHQ